MKHQHWLSLAVTTSSNILNWNLQHVTQSWTKFWAGIWGQVQLQGELPSIMKSAFHYAVITMCRIMQHDNPNLWSSNEKYYFSLMKVKSQRSYMEIFPSLIAQTTSDIIEEQNSMPCFLFWTMFFWKSVCIFQCHGQKYLCRIVLLQEQILKEINHSWYPPRRKVKQSMCYLLFSQRTELEIIHQRPTRTDSNVRMPCLGF